MHVKVLKCLLKYFQAPLCLVRFYVYDLERRNVGNRMSGEVSKISNAVDSGAKGNGNGLGRIWLIQQKIYFRR